MGSIVKGSFEGAATAHMRLQLTDQLSIEWGVASTALAGQTESGDLHIVQPFDGGVLLGVVDGLGHGAEAAHAARIAVDTLSQGAEKSVISHLYRAHETLRMTRGVVMSIASFRTSDHSLTWLSVGNVEGILLRADPKSMPMREIILLRGGVVGYQIPQPSASVLSVTPGDTLIFSTDGIRHFLDGLGSYAVESPAQLSHRICENYAKGTDDALVLVVRFVASKHE